MACSNSNSTAILTFKHRLADHTLPNIVCYSLNSLMSLIKEHNLSALTPFSFNKVGSICGWLNGSRRDQNRYI